MNSHIITWPPAYTIKPHRRARHVKIRASKPQCLEITVPYRFNKNDIPAILEEHKAWILKQLARLPALQENVLPHEIALHAIHETWTVHYMECNAKLEMFQRPNREIVLVGKVQNKDLCKEKLLAWVKDQSKIHLIQQLNMISEKMQLPFSDVTLRDQKTLWGSCTAEKNISLNYKLLFLPLHLAQHVMIHELCHTKHLNHSEKFWNLVANYDLAWQTNKRELKYADKYIPAWVR